VDKILLEKKIDETLKKIEEQLWKLVMELRFIMNTKN
jgi:hypothetical protein